MLAESYEKDKSCCSWRLFYVTVDALEKRGSAAAKEKEEEEEVEEENDEWFLIDPLIGFLCFPAWISLS